jgi:hypothetical protein|nr:MAG TPA: hypothetical protein [Caudoviricetes sp.]
MAKFELPIYGENDEIIKTYETDHIRWKLFVRAAAIKDNEMENDKSESEDLEQISDLLKDVFCGLTDEDLDNADFFDIINTFNQIAKIGDSINVKRRKSKN